MKTFFKLLLLFSVFGYLVFAVVRYSTAANPNVCKSVSIQVIDSVHSNLVTVEGVEKILKDANLYPLGQPMTKIQPIAICQALEKDSFICNVLCVETPGNHVRIVVDQRKPLLRVIPDEGADYFIDDKGTVMATADYKVDLPVATGNITQAYAKHQLRLMGEFLRTSPFWSEQVEQIHILPNQEADLIMRVGEQIVHFGPIDNIETKFNKLYAFYTKVLPEVGWKKYSEINVAFDKQVVATKRK